MTLITDTETLTTYCERLAGSPYVTVDTEFMRERTFWPKLCLVQVAGPDEAAAIDPLAEGMDLAPLFALMAATDTTKAFHAARQDLEIFLHLTGCMPAPVFDTQVAAMVCGFGDQVGYETLVAKLAKARVDKASRFTDWSIRPLSERQIDYALSDVTHLCRIYERLKTRIEAEGRSPWLEEEMATLIEPSTYEIDPLDAWKRIKSRSTNARFLAVLREVAAWRERMARDKDVPRNRILRDEALIEIAHHHPRTVEDLARTRGLGRGLAEGAQGTAILEAVVRGMAVPEKDCPQPSLRRDVPNRFGATIELLKVLLKVQCDAHDVAQRLVASSADIDAIAVDGEDADVPALRGWRRKVFGDAALELRAGRLAMAIDGRKLALIRLSDESAA